MKHLIALLLFASCTTNAVVETFEFESDVMRERYYRFVDELRCPNCQSQNLAGSNSIIAADLRKEVHRLLHLGRTDQQITEHMLNRYGDYILYRPQLKSETALLWFAPIIFLLIGLTVILFIVRRQKLAKVDVVEGHLAESEQQSLQRLLDESVDSSEDGDIRNDSNA